MELLWTCVYKHLFEHLLSVLLSTYLEVELQGQIAILFNFRKNYQTVPFLKKILFIYF